MDLQLKGKRALVTGSSSGIGVAVAKRLAEEGAAVVVHGRNAERAERVASEIRNTGGTAYVAIGDLSDDAGGDSVAKAMREQIGELDILVNNAGGSDDTTRSWDNTTTAQWIEEYEKNTVSVVRMIQHFLPDMKKNGWGRIMFLGSTSATASNGKFAPAYGAAKGGILSLTVSLSKTLAGTGITINTVTPGAVESPVMRSYVLSLPPYKGKTYEEVEATVARKWNIPAGRIGKPEDMAAAIAFLSSPLADFINGVNLRVDGGMSGYINT